MKKFSVLSGIVTAVVALSNLGLAQASQLPTGQSAVVYRADLDSELNMPTHAIEGSVDVDTIRGRASLTLVGHYPKRVCMPGHPCPAYIQPPKELFVSLPIVDVSVDGCNVRTIVARRDQRPVDGMFQQLVITDASQLSQSRRCAGIRYAAPTIAQYSTVSSGQTGTVESTSSMVFAHVLRHFMPRLEPMDGADITLE